MRRQNVWTTGVAAVLCAAALAAQDQTNQPPAAPANTQGQVEEVIVVTASRTEQPLHEAPATITVLDAKTIEESPTSNYGDLLRNVPGLNVSQTSARDINITARGSTNTLATSQLVLLDGRSLYLDFFGFVMWDFLPVNNYEIKQIEALQGPASAVWGANAMTGVINLITKRPKEMVGTNVLVGGGELGSRYGSVTHAGVSGSLGYKISGGYLKQDAFDRPTGAVPGANPPTVYPAFKNQGTKEPKADGRLDWDLADDSTFDVAAGYAGTSGIVHTGIGPFSIDSGGGHLSYGKLDWTMRALHVGFFGNFLTADSTNLLTVGVDGRPLGFSFKTSTYNLDISNTSVVGQHNIFTYGADARHSHFDLSIAPQGTSRKEYGAFVQDEILLGTSVRWLLGGRYDHLDPINGVFSPRTSLLFSLNPRNTIRFSFNRAFRAPSVINDYLNTTILLETPPLPPFGQPFVFPALADGNVKLNEERLDAFELGYVGTFGHGLNLTAAVYRNKTKDSIDFFVAQTYNSQNPPPGWLLPPIFLDFPPLAGALPALFSYRNVGEIVDQGFEIGLSQRPTSQWSWFANYSYQKTPEFKGVDPASQNLPPKNRLNLGLAFDQGRFFFSTDVNYADKAYWADVLNIQAFTDSYTMVNATVGVRFMEGRMTLSVLGSNIFDQRIQQHIFGDIISRKVTGQLAFRF